MAQQISITGLASNNVTPGTYVEEIFGMGDLSGDSTTRKILVLGQQISGSAGVHNTIYGPDTQTAVTNVNDVKTLCGVGSELAVCYEMVAKTSAGVNQIYIGIEPLATGNVATKTITFTGTATAVSSVKLYMGEKSVEVPIAVGDTPTVLSGKCIIAINALQTLVVASGTTTVVLTYRHIGIRGNLFTVYATISSSCGVTSDTSTVARLASGTGTPALATLITAMETGKYDYIQACDSYDDAAATTLLKASVLASAGPMVDRRQRLFLGWGNNYSDLANRTSWVSALNSERVEILSQHDSMYIPGLLAAQLVGIVSQYESQTVPRCNFNNFGALGQESAYWLIREPHWNSKPTSAQITNDLNLGVTPVACTNGGNTVLVKRVTSRYILTGTTTDYRIREPHKVCVTDKFVNDIQAILRALMQGKMIGADPPAGSQYVPNTITPRMIRAKFAYLLTQYKEDVLLENIKNTLDTLIIQRSTVNQSRFEFRCNLDVADICDQIVGVIGQVG